MTAMKPKKTNNYRVSIQLASRAKKIPSQNYLRRWARATLATQSKFAEVTIRIVDNKESAKLNQTYRHKSGPTNVLSFPFQPPAGIATPLLGDLVICAPVVAKEALAQNKILSAHWAHMIIHGILHLFGYDHLKKTDAAIMEKIEIKILARLGYPNPYE